MSCSPCIECQTHDIDSAYNNVLVNNTRWSKIYRQTVYLKNRAAKFDYNNGFILGNNVNANTPKTSFPGAFVANPLLNSDYSKLTINGRPVSIYDNLNDFDYKALYPSITSELNMSKSTLIGHLTIPTQVYEFENRFHRDDIKWKREAQFMDDLQSHNWIEFFHRWFNLGGYEDVYDDVIEYFTKVKAPNGILTYHDFDNVTETLDAQRSVFVHCSTKRDWDIVNAMMEKDKAFFALPRFQFEKSDFKSFSEIYDSLKDGYLYSKPKQISTGVAS